MKFWHVGDILTHPREKQRIHLLRMCMEEVYLLIPVIPETSRLAFALKPRVFQAAGGGAILAGACFAVAGVPPPISLAGFSGCGLQPH